MLKKLSLILLSSLFIQQVSGQINQKRKKTTTNRVSKAPKIDGLLEDDAWKAAKVMSDFVIFKPDNGTAVSEAYQTEVKVVYDNDALYISAKMLDPKPEGIPRQFATRDNFSQSDFFLVSINPNDDGQNPFEFIVQSTGNQADAKISNGDKDFNWSAVWESNVQITDTGWNVEMKIPYRAIRFANRPLQSWGFNFQRSLEKQNERQSWNFIDNAVGTWTQYDGLIEGFRNIKPPTRLNFYPYASVTNDSYNGETTTDWSIGMDVKYGLSENFTLDATLIPDFSQAGFDNVELNLGPFEQEFSEQRQFFTEGTELFTKGKLFYSRRVGGAPTDQFNVQGKITADEEIIDSPSKVAMLNAIKVSGRTKKGLGIGVFNAVTATTEVTIRNNSTQETRKEVINPFSNYNILVLDQQFNQNSSITLINTNVTRDGRFRDANVTGLLWHVESKDSKYNIDGSFKLSAISDDEYTPNTGHTFETSFGKRAGNWDWQLGYNLKNKDFNPNDLGILFRNNEQKAYGNIRYKTLKPVGNFNRYSVRYYQQIKFQHYSGIYTGLEAGFSFNAQLKSRFGFGGNFNFDSESRDYFEPRKGSTSTVYFLKPERRNIRGWISTNYQKKFAIDIRSYISDYKDNPKLAYGLVFSPRYRFSNQFSLIYKLDYAKTNNDQGYATEENNTPVFGQRDRKNYTNSLSGKFSFSTLSSISISLRHYWGTVRYEDVFYDLNSNGTLAPNNYTANEDLNFNSWNLDINYIWQFAPGSQLIAFYRNAIFNENSNSSLNFTENLERLFEQPNQHVFSLRLVYFIDYNKVKNFL
jgi:hypothetical protein